MLSIMTIAMRAFKAKPPDLGHNYRHATYKELPLKYSAIRL